MIVDNFNSTIGIFYVPAIIHKDGRLEAQENSLPWIPYDFQDPFSRKYCICKYDEKENWLDQSAYKGIDNPQGKNLSWEKYVHEVIEYYKRTTKLSWEDNSLVEFHNPNLEYPTDEELLVCLDETINADFHVMRLYKNILVNEGDLLDEFQYPLFNTMIGAFKDRKRQVAYDDLNIDRMKEHLGTMGNKLIIIPLFLKNKKWGLRISFVLLFILLGFQYQLVNDWGPNIGRWYYANEGATERANASTLEMGTVFLWLLKFFKPITFFGWLMLTAGSFLLVLYN